MFPWSAIALSSYSAYLIHPLAIHAAVSVAVGNSIIYWAAAVGATVVGTAFLYFAIEKPSISLRDRYISRDASRANVAQEVVVAAVLFRQTVLLQSFNDVRRDSPARRILIMNLCPLDVSRASPNTLSGFPVGSSVLLRYRRS